MEDLSINDIISEQIQLGIYTTKSVDKRRSFVWNIFKTIVTEDGSVLERFVYCTVCKKILRYNPKTCATSNLKDHPCARQYINSIYDTIDRETNQTSSSISGEIGLKEDEGHKTTITTNNPQNVVQDELVFIKEEIKIEPEVDREFLTDDEVEAESDDRLSIETKISNGTYKLSNKRKYESELWTLMAQILRNDNTILPNYVCCRKCRNVFQLSHSYINLYNHECARYIMESQEDGDHDVTVNAAFISYKISKGIYTVCPERRGEGALWDIMASILREDGTSINSHIVCRKCHSVLKLYDKKLSNTYRHKCYVEHRLANHAPDMDLVEDSNEFITTETTEKCNLTTALISESIATDNYTINGGIKTGNKKLPVLGSILQQDNTILEECVHCRKCSKTLPFKKDQLAKLSQHKCCQRRTYSRLKQSNLR
ncbi:uncharacterized protein LOC131995380 [Stomoxys calcitrans]|uniref:uncharacterized protein LOC131995380 n=1 Tax=Stomoxys calcitrans TaxID=35570 RepID=UPI0027E33606|nr:uncharacterized protein LOC131995380 [Stomoxys calcitrans]